MSQTIDDWRNYPQNLHFSSLDVDACRIDNRISTCSKDLFVDRDASVIASFKLGISSQDGSRNVEMVRSDPAEVLTGILAQRQETPILFLEQSFTWSRLQICEEHFRKLFSCLKVHPDFLDIVHLFCQKIRPLEEGFNGFFVNKYRYNRSIPASLDSEMEHQSYNLGYNVKYVARHGRDCPRDPYSIREIGVYQQFCSKSRTSAWIFLQAPAKLQARLQCAFGEDNKTTPEHQIRLHGTVLLSVSEDWRDYLSYLEEDFSRLVDRGFYTNLKGPQFSGDVEADYSDIRKLQILTDKLRRLQHIVKLNIRLGKEMRDSIKSLQNAELQEAAHVDSQIGRFVYDQQTNFDRIDCLLQRSGGITQLIQNLLEIRATESGKRTNLEMQKLTEQGIEENRLVKRLTEKASKDTKSMMTIALISAIFLPATFLAGFFGQGDEESLIKEEI
ncbi:hypothetical protein FKW77_007425 [Venturia effusa]|uniref:CorA-like transporter domain-containing protein n=1 Tax=Venturia effusa TaxID=50376 RepID=A0A517LCM7_9PEZI|nr:hypothetical protein FKW77_007425 [Venturia effusa]